jgi:L-asparaginase/Glu-tRNA(Gln) amidotransferase subunit D
VQHARSRRSTGSGNGSSSSSSSSTTIHSMVQGPHVVVPQPLPHVLILHTGGTLGMDVKVHYSYSGI